MSQGNGEINGNPAAIVQTGNRIDCFWGGVPSPGGQGHGHLVSKDGLNANYVREPGGQVIVNDNLQNPYQGYQSRDPRHHR